MYEDDLASGTDYEYNMDFDRAMQESYTKSQNKKKIDYKQEFERLKKEISRLKLEVEKTDNMNEHLEGINYKLSQENETLKADKKSYEFFENVALEHFYELEEKIEKLELSLMTVPVKFQKIVYKVKA